jgi:hypothetical protein
MIWEHSPVPATMPVQGLSSPSSTVSRQQPPGEANSLQYKGVVPDLGRSTSWRRTCKDSPSGGTRPLRTRFDDEAEQLHGEVPDTRDVITFQGPTVEE